MLGDTVVVAATKENCGSYRRNSKFLSLLGRSSGNPSKAVLTPFKTTCTTGARALDPHYGVGNPMEYARTQEDSIQPLAAWGSRGPTWVCQKNRAPRRDSGLHLAKQPRYEANDFLDGPSS